MKVLGVSLGHDASVCLVIDGVLVTAISAERIKKVKKTPYIDWEVLDYILNPQGLTIDDIDLIEDTSEWEETKNMSSILLEEDMPNTTTTE